MSATRLRTAGRIFTGLGFIGLGITHFMAGQFTTGRASAWPVGVPGGLAWAYVSGAAIALVGLSIVVGRQTRAVLIATAVLIAAWALLRQLPTAVAGPILGPSWTHAGKALAFFGGMLVLAGSSSARAPRGAGQENPAWRLKGHEELLITTGRACLAVFFLIAGLQHFKYTPFVASLIPGWVPGDAVAWARIAGVALVCAGLGLLVPLTAHVAALLSGAMVFSWVWIVHVPRSLGAMTDRIAVWEALAVSGIALVIASHLPTRGSKLAHRETPELDLVPTRE